MLTAFALALLTETPPIDPRANLLRFCARLEQRLATASRPAEPMVLMSGLPETRFVYIDGVGPVFLLHPGLFPPSRRPVRARPRQKYPFRPQGLDPLPPAPRSWFYRVRTN